MFSFDKYCLLSGYMNKNNILILTLFIAGIIIAVLLASRSTDDVLDSDTSVTPTEESILPTEEESPTPEEAGEVSPTSVPTIGVSPVITITTEPQ